MGSTPSVRLYVAAGCHLCERVQGQLAALRDEFAFALDEVDITGDPELERRYREWIPVVEIDGERAYVYSLDVPGFRRRLSQTAR